MTGNGCYLYIFVAKSGSPTGHAFHSVFREYKTSGEWFSVNPILALQAMCENIESFLGVHGLDSNESREAVRLTTAKQKLAAWRIQ